MNSCILFDINEATSLDAVVMALKDKGYWNAWGTDGKIYHLPSNALWKPNCELSQAKMDLMEAIESLNHKAPSSNIELKRCIVLPVNPWDGIEGERR